MNGNRRKGKHSRLWTLLLVAGLLFLTACQKTQATQETVVYQSVYVTDGYFIFILSIPGDTMYDYETISAQLCEGNAIQVKKSMEENLMDLDIQADPASVIAAQNVLGMAHIYLGDYSTAQENFDTMLKMLNEPEIKADINWKAIACNNLSQIYDWREQAEEAKEYLRLAREICDEPYMDLVLEKNRYSLRWNDSTMKSVGEQIKEGEKLVEREQKMIRGQGVITYVTKQHIASAYLLLGQGEKTLNIDEKYLEHIPKEPYFELIRATFWTSKGKYYFNEKDYKQAIAVWEMALMERFQEEQEKNLTVLNIYSNLGMAYALVENYDLAISYLERVCVDFPKGARDFRARAYSNLGDIYALVGNYEDAKENHLKAYILLSTYDIKHAAQERQYILDLIWDLDDPRAAEDFSKWFEEQLEGLDEGL